MPEDKVYAALYDQMETLVKAATNANDLATLAHAFAAVKNSDRK